MSGPNEVPMRLSCKEEEPVGLSADVLKAIDHAAKSYFTQQQQTRLDQEQINNQMAQAFQTAIEKLANNSHSIQPSMKLSNPLDLQSGSSTNISPSTKPHRIEVISPKQGKVDFESSKNVYMS